VPAHQHALAEKLCAEALQKDKPYGKPVVWAYYLERIYAEIANKEKQIEMVRLILMRGDKTYYALLSMESELSRLLGVVQANNIYIEHYGKQRLVACGLRRPCRSRSCVLVAAPLS
jgi:hypothetical protein